MVFKYQGWTLYVIEPKFKNIGKRKMYFFSKKKPKRGTPCDKPNNMVVEISKYAHLPYLRNTNGVSLYQEKKLMKKV